MTHETLARFQDRFTAALYAVDDAEALRHAAYALQPGFSVYRNSIFKACIDTLELNFPATTRLVGQEWFRSAAALYAQKHPPRDARLIYYGEDFPSFLEQLPTTKDLPYLPAVATLDRLWLEAYTASDELRLPAASIAALKPEELARAVLHVSPLARLVWFEHFPAYSIWYRNRIDLEDQGEMLWQAEGALLVRSDGIAKSMPLTRSEYFFLEGCRQGKLFLEAAQAAYGSSSEHDSIAFLIRMLAMGTFSSIHLNHQR